MTKWFSSRKKTWVALASAALTTLTELNVHGSAQQGISALILLAGVFGVHTVKNS